MFRFLRRVFILLVLFVIIFLIFRFIKPEATSRFVDRIKTIPTTISSRFHREKKSKIVINWDTTFSSGNFEIKDNYSIYNDNYDYIIDDETYVIDSDNSSNADTNTAEQWNNSDLEWLEELNREIEAILASWKNEETNNENIEQEWLIGDKENKITIIDVEREEWDNTTERLEFIELAPWAIEQPEPTWTLAEIIWEVITDWNTSNQQGNSSNQTSTSTQTTSTQTNTTTTSSQTTTTTTTYSPKQQCWECSAEGEWRCLSVQDCEDLARDFWTYN